ncbi:DUF2637 domain-containing protein [Actinoplanes couchii]|uniref:DUF2637 domain-containing protein n=1 Tax=Actinoplanes couchii TaxID=403638 RepID=A0ABQ3X3F1_9ACTN|nr:DUF2637 domain-containing protein [Actinoplanes couchii]MDR6322783.1 hypothetical protein [Actinoplanes couchii]GID53022.1 hypothetical protein Aco03nite_014260 [Actinoplanes couchii]
MTTRKSGRGWAYTGAFLGGAVSIAANVAHSFIPPKEVANPAGWSPELGAVVGAVVWPVFLFVAVEILARVAWPTTLVWQIVRWGGILPVAFVAALVSYRHLSGLLGHYGEEPIVTILGPLAVDGLMVMATGAILATGNHRTTPAGLRLPNLQSLLNLADQDASNVPAPTDTSTPPSVPPVPVDVRTPAVDTPTVTPAPALPVAEESARTPEHDSTAAPTPDVVAGRITRPTSTSPDRSTATSLPVTPAPRPRPRKPDATPTAPLPRPAIGTSANEPDVEQLKLPTVTPDLLNRAREAAQRYRAENNGEQISAGQLAARLRINSGEAADALAHLAIAPIPSLNGRRPSRATR